MNTVDTSLPIGFCVDRLTRFYKAIPMSVTIKTETDIAHMRVACRLASEVLDYIAPFIKAGISTGELDRMINDYMVNVQKTVSATLGYQPPGYPPYPKSCCISLNDVICHGVPSDDKILKNGDILNIDVTIITPEGYFGDTSRMFTVGEPSIAAKRLCDVTYECMWLGIAQVKEGATLGDIGAAIAAHAHANGMSVVREYCGHGIGKVFHEEPQVLHYGVKGQGMKLKAGMIFTIEPMINAGKRDLRTMSDGWTVKTKDRSLSAQWEHTVLVTPTGYEVLTLSDGYPALPEFIKTTRC
jgi:methionyl aminopeptidase